MTIIAYTAIAFVVGLFTGMVIRSNPTTTKTPARPSLESILGKKGCELTIVDDSYYPGECPDPMDVTTRYGGVIRQIKTGKILYKTPYYGSKDEVYKKVSYVMPGILDIIAKNS